jgi:hypothetical protein
MFYSVVIIYFCWQILTDSSIIYRHQFSILNACSNLYNVQLLAEVSHSKVVDEWCEKYGHNFSDCGQDLDW